MKMKNRLIFAAFMIVTQSAFAARLTVFNESGSGLFIQISDSKGNLVKANIVNPNESVTYNTYGWSSFGSLQWRKALSMNDERNQKGLRLPMYTLNVVSPGNMLSGKIRIGQEGIFGKNFSPSGVGEFGGDGFRYGQLGLGR